MVKRVSKECEQQDSTTLANTTTTIAANGDVTMNVTSSQRSLFSEIESKIGEFDQIKDKENAAAAAAQQALQDQDDQDGEQNLEPAEKGMHIDSRNK